MAVLRLAWASMLCRVNTAVGGDRMHFDWQSHAVSALQGAAWSYLLSALWYVLLLLL